MYTEKNYKTKKQLKDDVAAGIPVAVCEPGPFPAQTDGQATIEGPHFPAPHTWYARVVLKAGKVIKVLK